MRYIAIWVAVLGCCIQPLGANADEKKPEEKTAEAKSVEELRYRATQLDHLDPRALDAAIDGSVFDGFNPDNVLAQIRCPVHLLAGQAELGGAMTDADVDRLVHTVPDYTVTHLHDVGHGIHGEQPRAYLHELKQFWQWVH